MMPPSSIITYVLFFCCFFFFLRNKENINNFRLKTASDLWSYGQLLNFMVEGYPEMVVRLD